MASLSTIALRRCGDRVDVAHGVDAVQRALVRRNRRSAARSARDRPQAGCATVSALSSARRFMSVPPHLSQVPGLGRRLEAVVIAFAAAAAGEAAGDPVDHRGVVDLKADGGVDLLPGLGQQRVQRLGLHGGAREPVKDHAAGAIGLGQPVAQDGDDDLVADQLAGFHHGLGLLAGLGARGHGGAQQIAGGQLDQTEAVLPASAPACLCRRPEGRAGSERGRCVMRCSVHALIPRFIRFSIRSSTTDGSARVEVSPRAPKSFSAILRRMRRMILPERVFGRPGAHWIRSGVAIGPISVRTQVRSSLRSSSVGSTPFIRVT